MTFSFRKAAAAAAAMMLAVCFIFSGLTAQAATTKAKTTSEKTYKDAGYYVLSSAVEDGQEIDTTWLEIFGLSGGIILNDDGTGIFYFTDEYQEITWSDGKLTVEGESIDYTIKKDVLIIAEESENLELRFTKSKDPAPTLEEVKEMIAAAGEGYTDSGEDGWDYDTDRDLVIVENVDELIDALNDYTTVVLLPGTYNLTEWIEENGEDLGIWDWALVESEAGEGEAAGTEEKEPQEPASGVYRDTVHDGFGLILMDYYGLTLTSADPEDPAEIVVEPRYADVLSFVGSGSITLDNLVLGHTKEQGSCQGDVLSFYDCWRVNVNACELYGCGTYALTTEGCGNIKVDGCDIHDCSYGCAMLVDSYDTRFMHTDFHDCAEFTMFEVNGGNADFIDCSFKKLDGNLFSVSGDVRLVQCEFDKDARASLDENEQLGDAIREYSR